ncbi:MAG: hypothetical protein WDA20_04990 [Desulfuromonadales bacterium]|jgi:hypothetical protein
MELLLILIAASIVVGIAGLNRKFGFWGYFFASLLLTPILGILLVIASDRKAPPKRAAGSTG